MPIARESLLLPSILVSISFYGQAQEPVQHRAYRSPAGTLELLVDPSQRWGAGPARCRMSRSGELVWEREVAITFLDALVDEDGSVAAYGYSEGIRNLRNPGELVVAVLAPDGSLWAEERHARVGPRSCGGSLLPKVGDMRRCADGFALEVLGVSEAQYDWWVYDRASCRKTREQRLAPDELVTGLDSSSTSDGDDAGRSPLLELTLLGRVLFPWPVRLQAADEAPLPELRNRRPHKVHVDRAGRIWISELSTRIVHAFASTGTPLFERSPDAATFRPYRPAEWLRVRDDGTLFMCADGAIEVIDWPGERGSRIPVESSLPPRWEFLPGTSDRWVVSFSRSIELVDDEDGIVWRTERAPNGRWLETLWSSAVDVDGTLAVVDESSALSRVPTAWVHLFATNGQPNRSIRLPDDWQYGVLLGSPVTIHRGLLALLGEREVLFLGASKSVLGRAPLPEDAQESRFLSFSPSGNELWVFTPSRVEMWRFEVPRSLRE